MLIAVDKDNHNLIIGLHAENMRHLNNDEPIRKKFKDVPDMIENVPELADWTLFILGPEDLERFVARL